MHRADQVKFTSLCPPAPPLGHMMRAGSLCVVASSKMYLLICFGIVSSSVLQRNGTEEDHGKDHDKGEVMGSETPCSMSNTRVFCCVI